MRKTLHALAAIAACGFLVSCSGVKVAPASGGIGPAVTYGVILYGLKTGDDPVALVIIEPEDDGYEAVMKASEYDFKTFSGLNLKQAEAKAGMFMGLCRSAVGKTVNAVTTPASERPIAYEITPLYPPAKYGGVLGIGYKLNEKERRLYITPSPKAGLNRGL